MFCQAAILADGKHRDIVAVLVFGQQVAARAVQRKVAGRFAAAGLALDPGKAAVLQNVVGRDAVMAAIGGIQEFKKFPGKQGKSFLKQKNLSLNRKIVSCRRDAKTPAARAGVFAVCLLGERENHIRNGSFVRVR